MESINERLLKVGQQFVKIAEDENLPAAAFVYLLETLRRSAIEAMEVFDDDDEPMGSC